MQFKIFARKKVRQLGSALAHHGNWNYVVDPDVPTLRPWVLRQESATTRLYERNAFWYCVDTADNQLPYIDRVQATLTDGETYKLKVLSGEVTWPSSPLSRISRSTSRTRPAATTRCCVLSGLFGGMHTYHAAPRTMKSRFWPKSCVTCDFAGPLSLRHRPRLQMNETLYSGMGVPRQITVNPDVSYYKPEWGEEHPYARYDPDQANQLLDEMGLTERDRDGFRKLRHVRNPQYHRGLLR